MPAEPERELEEIRREGVEVIELKCPMCRVQVRE
jgi:heterodisulfide reductase subunit B